ncbi:hypothetical protein ACYSNR_07440 [Enterococcus sp. LJL128]
MKNFNKVVLGGVLVLLSFILIACGSNNEKKEDTKAKENGTVQNFKDKGYLFSDRSYRSFDNMVYALVIDNPDTGITFESYVKLEKKGDDLIPDSIMSIRYNEKDKDIDSEVVYFQGKHSADEEDTLDAYTETLEELDLSKGDFIDFVVQYAKDNYKVSEEDLEKAKDIGSDDDASDESSDEDEDSDNSKTEKPDFGPLSDSWDSFQIELDGEVIQLPLTYKEFETFGWSANDSNDVETTDIIKAGDSETYFQMDKGSANIRVTIENFSDEDKKLEDCDISELSIEVFLIARLDNGITLPGGIKIDDKDNSVTADTIKEAYGEPEKVVEATGFLIYQTDYKNKYSMRFADGGTGDINKIQIKVDDQR